MSNYPFLVFTDPHFTDNPQDEYRWSIFDRIEEACRDYGIKTILCLGDLTDQKDRHSAKLVNRVVRAFKRLAGEVERVIILKGNHDYLQKEQPFFEFLSEVDGVSFIDRPVAWGDWTFVPHSRDIPLPGLDQVSKHTKFCFLHQTVSGAITSNGTEMQGEVKNRLPHADTCTYYAGDIHVPQVVGDVEYVGSPYPVHFGDDYEARMLVVSEDKAQVSLPWTGIRRYAIEIRDPDDLKILVFSKGDQIKVRVRLARRDLDTWPEVRRRVHYELGLRGVMLHGLELIAPRVRAQLRESTAGLVRADVTPASVLTRYANSRGIDDALLAIGEELMQ